MGVMHFAVVLVVAASFAVQLACCGRRCPEGVVPAPSSSRSRRSA
jgi:hypothetical protein